MIVSRLPIYIVIFSLLTLVATLIEGLLLKFMLRWSVKRALLSALIANTITILVGLTIAFLHLFPRDLIPDARWTDDSRIRLATSIWAHYRYWWLGALGAWLVYYLVALFVKGSAVYFGAPGPFPLKRAVRAAAIVSAVTCVLALPLWLRFAKPEFGSVELVHRSQWLPGVDELFVYDGTDGERWVGTTEGRQLGKLRKREDIHVPEGSIERFRQQRSALPGDETVAGTAHLRRKTALGPAGRPLLAYSANITHLLGGLTSIALAYQPWVYSHSKDGTEASIMRGCLSVYAEDGRSCEFAVTGGFGYDLDCSSANVLPGGRYVLYECSGEIMVLDIVERKVVGLFRGTRPVALASLESQATVPPQDEQPAE